MLPSDVKERKTATAVTSAEQQNLDNHLREIPPRQRAVTYSDALFRDAAIEWLISTGQVSFSTLFFEFWVFIMYLQPIQAVDHPSFKKMIDVASRAPNGVSIPNRKATRHEIMDSFKTQMSKLKEHLNVRVFLFSIINSNVTQSKLVKGEVNLTCDAWQASNVDGYFAVTGHWIEGMATTAWELQCAVLGFTQLNNAHNGQRLGQALFKIVDRVGIAHKVSSFYNFDLVLTLVVGWTYYM